MVRALLGLWGLNDLVDVVKDAVVWAYDTLLWVWYAGLQLLFDQLEGLVPAPVWADFAVFYEYWKFANYWCPLGECILLVLVLWTFQMFFAAVKIIIKLIPFIG